MSGVERSEHHIPGDLRYTREHEWVRHEGEVVRVGVTDYAQEMLHEVVYVETPRVGREVGQMEAVGAAESVKAVSDIYSPLSGVVVAVNSRLQDEPELLNRDPYGEGWILVLRPSRPGEELPSLLTPEQYAGLLQAATRK